MQLRFSGVFKSYNGKTVLENISGAINAGDKIGLVGRNGVGKTTLARLLTGQEVCDGGHIELLPSSGKIFYLEQYPAFVEKDTVCETVLRAVKNNYGVRDYGRRNDLNTIAEKSLKKLGISEERWVQGVNSLSGGEKTMLALCCVLVSDFDFLILDEPTNHLDLENCERLENFLGTLAKPVVVISHDRFFLDKVVTKIWELTLTGLKVYKGNYSDYKKQKDIEQKSIEQGYRRQQLKMQQLKKVINARKNWYESAHTAAGKNDFYRSKAKKHARVFKTKKKELERLKKRGIDKPVKVNNPAFELINKNIPEEKSAPFLVRGENVGKSFARKVLFEGAFFNIKRGDKIVLLGANGAGKTTFLRIIAGLINDYSGKVIISPAVKLGYFAQELDDLNFSASILEDVLIAGAGVEEARPLLASLLFRGDDVYKKIGDLSMGEKGRVVFAKIILAGANFLILDEPTNYMDIASKEKIEEVLANFKGSLIFVTHDRYFMRLADRVFEIVGKKLNCYNGNYEYYLAKQKGDKGKTGITDIDHRDLMDNINRLECDLAYLGGRLNEIRDEEEKEKLREKFLAVAKELNRYKEGL
ncbi:MAG: ribosomal protection-like ABC-F family protein [Dethiobacteria bacterium]